MTVKRKNSNRKGKAGERELAKYLTERGFPAERGKQYQGGHDSPDVRCPRLNAAGIDIECKRVENLSVHKAMEQAVNDAGDNTAVVMHRRNGTEWLATMRLDDWLVWHQALPQPPDKAKKKAAQ